MPQVYNDIYYWSGQTPYYRPTYIPVRWEWTTSNNITMTNNNSSFVWPSTNITASTGWQVIQADIQITSTLTQEEIAAAVLQEQGRQEQIQRMAAQEAAAYVERRHAATRRARSLLEMVLTSQQRETLRTSGRFHVVGSRGRRYCINANGQSGNVDLLDDNGVVAGRFCAHPGGPYLPDPDAWLAQMLALQTDEEAFLRVANLHWGARPVPQPA